MRVTCRSLAFWAALLPSAAFAQFLAVPPPMEVDPREVPCNSLCRAWLGAHAPPLGREGVQAEPRSESLGRQAEPELRHRSRWTRRVHARRPVAGLVWTRRPGHPVAVLPPERPTGLPSEGSPSPDEPKATASVPEPSAPLTPSGAEPVSQTPTLLPVPPYTRSSASDLVGRISLDEAACMAATLRTIEIKGRELAALSATEFHSYRTQIDALHHHEVIAALRAKFGTFVADYLTCG
jgi:hypothetical protein